MTTAHYFDGRNGRQHSARLAVAAGHLHIVAPDVDRRVPLTAVRVAEPFARAPLVLHLDDDAICEVPAGAARQQLLDAIGYRKSRVVRCQERWPAAVLALALLVALLALTYLRGVPAVAERVAARVPVSFDVAIGRLALADMEARHVIAPSRLSGERIAEVEAGLARAVPAHPRVSPRVLVRAAANTGGSDDLGANAVALPDGTIIVTDELVRLALNRDGELDAVGRAWLLGVIGHEVGHIERRHAVRAVLGSSLSSALSAILMGDFSDAAAGLPAMLTQLQYSRDMELEADDYAVAVLRRNGLGPACLADILRALERRYPDQDKIPRWLSHSLGYLSTHPATDERIARLRAAGARQK